MPVDYRQPVSGAANLASLIEDAAGSKVAVDELLRRLKVVASRAGIPELESWVQQELDGYHRTEDLPPYRGPFTTHVLGHFSGMFQSQAANVPIAPMLFPEEYRAGLFQAAFFEDVAALEALAAANSELTIPWPADALMLVQVLEREGKLDLNGNVLQEAHQVVSRSVVINLLRTVRDRVLALALRLEAENPQLGEAGVRAEGPAVGRDVQIIVHGGQPNIAVASQHFSQGANVDPGDRASLFARLRDIGVDNEALGQLRDALDADEAADTPATTGPGERVLVWLGRLTLGVGAAAGAAAGTDLAKQAGDALGGFFG